jgi:outer membrane protein
VALSTTLWGAPAHTQTLSEALAMAYLRNPQIMSGRAKLRATDEQASQALSNWRPTVSATGSVGASRNETTTSSGSNSNNTSSLGNFGGQSQTVNPRSYQLTLSQPVWRGGRTVAQTAQAENTILAERANLTATEQTALLNAVTAYMDVLRDEALLGLQIDNEQILREQVQASDAQARAGTALDTDVLLARSRLSTAIANRRTAEQTLATSRETYRQYVGDAPQRLIFPQARPGLPDTLDAAKDAAATVNPNVVAASFNRRAASDNVDVVRGQLLPTVSLNGTATRNVDQQVTGRTSDALSVTAQVSVPLYEAGSVYSQARQAAQTVTQRLSDFDTARDQAVQSVASAWNSLQAARASILSTQDAVRAQEAAVRGIQAQNRAGTRTILDVLNEQQTLLNNRINLVTAQRNEVVAEYQVISGVGRLTARDLGLDVPLYDPTQYYDSVRNKWFGLGDIGRDGRATQ